MRKIIYFLLFLCGSLATFAQTAEIRGFAYDKKTGDAIIFSKVFIKGSTLAASTDVNGFYSITRIPAGNYILCSYSLGFDTLMIPVTLKAGEKLTKNLFLEQSMVNLRTVDISGQREEALTEVKVSAIKITPKQISQLPSVGGEPDLAQYLQVLPGVIFTGDQGGQLYIRGGSPIQNKVLLDGMVIYNPFHSIGLFSVFETDIIRNADVYTGGFSAEYGGRISAIMDITTRDGNKKRFSGKVGTSPFISRIILEGPLNKYNENGSNASFLITGKTSYLEQTSKTIYSYVDTAGLPYNFTDFYGKMSINGANGSKINLFGFNYSDKVNYKVPAAIRWSSLGFGTNFVLVPGSSSALIGGNFAFSRYNIELDAAAMKPRTSKINGFNGGLNYTYFFGDDELKYGFELMGFQTAFRFTNTAGLVVEQEDFTTEIGSYIKYKLAIKRLVLEPSFRAHYYASLSEFSPEPRLGLKLILTDWLRFKAAGGLYSQNLLSAVSDRDVVNLFYGFLSGPDNLQKKFDGKEVTSALQKATHVIAGFEIDLSKSLSLNTEVYVKYFNQLTNINRDKIYADDATHASTPDYQKKDFIVEKGTAKGFDVTLKYEHKAIYLWVVYSLGFLDRYDGIRTYNPHYDRRHNINIIGTYRFGRNDSWELDARWSLGSGFPFSQTQGFYPQNQFNDGVNSDYVNANGDLGIIYGELNKGRLPWYHRLDVSVKKQWDITENSVLEANAGITNAYNRENIFYFDRVTYSRKNQLPFLPSAGLSLTF